MTVFFEKYFAWKKLRQKGKYGDTSKSEDSVKISMMKNLLPSFIFKHNKHMWPSLKFPSAERFCWYDGNAGNLSDREIMDGTNNKLSQKIKGSPTNWIVLVNFFCAIVRDGEAAQRWIY